MIKLLITELSKDNIIISPKHNNVTRNSACGRPSLLDLVAESGDRQKVFLYALAAPNTSVSE